MPRRKMAHTFKVVYEPEPDGSAWNVSIPDLSGCHTYGRSIAEARRNIREALSLFEEEFEGKADEVAAQAVFEEEFKLPPEAQKAVKTFQVVRLKAEQAQEAFRLAETKAAQVLLATVSSRDAGEMLKMSQEGVRKIARRRDRDLVKTNVVAESVRKRNTGGTTSRSARVGRSKVGTRRG
jgi:predicted RNase H-like HicB family nuclease